MAEQEDLHEGIIPSDMDLQDIVAETVSGSYSGDWTSESVRVSRSEMADLLEGQGSDPAFLLGDDWAEEPDYINRVPEEGENHE